MIISRVSLLLLTQAALFTVAWSFELPNPGFEQPLDSKDGSGWLVKEYGHAVSRDKGVRFGGRASVRFVSNGEPLSSGIELDLPADLVREHAFRLSGHVRTSGLLGAASFFVIVDKADGSRYYDHMGGSRRAVTGDSGWTRIELLIPQFPTATAARFGTLVYGNGSAWFDELRLERIDADPGLSAEAEQYLEAALGIMATNSVKRHEVDWPDLRKRSLHLASGATSAGDTYDAIDFAIRILGDNHSWLYRPDIAARIRNDGLDSNALGDWVAASGRRLSGGFAYVKVPHFRGTSAERTTRFADDLHGLVKDLDSTGTCGWIVDLRGNSGGNVFPMLAGLGPLLGDGNAGGGVTADGNFIPRNYEDGRAGDVSISTPPYALLRPDSPIAVLTDEGTASSGEATALAFIGKPGVRTFGQPTAGATTGNAGFALVDGALLNLAITTMVDRTGKVYGGPIIPDVRVDSAGTSGPDATLRAALAWLQAASSTRSSCSIIQST